MSGDEVAAAIAEKCRHVPFITLSEVKPRVWITLSGCNFRCKGCFSIARYTVGKCMRVDELSQLINHAIICYYGCNHVEEAVITGGEPTLHREYLVNLVRKLRNIASKIILDTNGFLLDDDYLDELISAGLSEVMFDMKAYDESLHIWYTGFTNKKIIENIKNASKKTKIIINTVLIPDVIGDDEIEKIAEFVSSLYKISKERIDFRINPFRAHMSSENISRDATEEDLKRAYARASKHLSDAVIGRSCVVERRIERRSGWITVFPDGEMRRRTLNDYKHMRL